MFKNKIISLSQVYIIISNYSSDLVKIFSVLYCAIFPVTFRILFVISLITKEKYSSLLANCNTTMYFNLNNLLSIF